VNGTNQVVATYVLTQDGKPLTSSSAAGLAPNWTLAALSIDPVSGLPAWQSQLLTGAETLQQLPIDGPGTPPQFIAANVRQPGSESGGTVAAQGNGTFTYTFQNALPQGFDPAQTLRVGVWLGGVTGTTLTTSIFDFAPGGGALQARDLVLDDNCNKCHGVVQAHGGFRTGVKICLTCHTYQNADADTVDPAAIAGTTPATNPNPLDLGRLIHGIHRGKNLPTLYVANPAQPNPNRANVALPFFPGRNAPLPGQKFSVVGFRSGERVYGQVTSRTDNDQPAATVVTGVGFPQDLRNCDACHGGAPQTAEHINDISRRTCYGCHPDTWFQDPAQITDKVHFVHPGGAQPDDTLCSSCHVPTPSTPVVDASTPDLHVAPILSPNYSALTAAIVGVQNMKAGQSPTVTFSITDRDGLLSPLNAPSPAMDSTSPVPRALSRVALTISGSTAPDYATGNSPIIETVPLTSTASSAGQFSYTFKAALPAGATGTWVVALEARRSAAAPFYDPASDSFSWPFTGETITEYADNPVQYVDVSVGSTPGGRPTARRQVVSRDNCNACHLQLTAHGDLRHNVEYCVACHAPDLTDWSRRPKDVSGNVDLATVFSPSSFGTYDDLEERSVHFKVLIHRIHTGGRTGTAELDLARPFAVYGFPGGAKAVSFFDDVEFPGNLANCTLCHQGTSYAVESIPAGAFPTVANETATILHLATAAPVTAEARVLPAQAACLSCHATAIAQFHAQQNTTAAGEQCVHCHGLGEYMSVQKVHGIR
jgi:OmcA/MtrC family decaheme c-type cytochrome